MHSMDRYAEIRKQTARVRERPLLAAPKIPNELELQARWFAGEFGRKFQTLVGELVEIVQFGFWNREAGPDFQDAAIRLAGGPILRGPIEIDLLDRNWELHGHAINPAFDDAILHVFLERSGVEFFARTSTHRNVPQLQLDLAAIDLDRQGKSTRSYLRSLWDRWWKYREQFSRLVLPAKLWKTSGARPLNHPHRRLGALAVMVAEWKTFSALAGASKATPLVSFLTDLRHDFWSRHYSLAAASASSSLALIGNSRAAEILANLVYPLAVNDDREIWNDYKNLRAQLSNQAARIAAARLFAGDPRQRDFVRSLVGQQGLLQIYEDFCLRDASDCASCPLPEQLRRW